MKVEITSRLSYLRCDQHEDKNEYRVLVKQPMHTTQTVGTESCLVSYFEMSLCS